MAKFFDQTFYHESRHGYQSLIATAGNDADSDFLVLNIPTAPTTIFVDSTASRAVCNYAGGPNGTTLTLAYHGDSVPDSYNGPDWAIYALEMDALVFASSH